MSNAKQIVTDYIKNLFADEVEGQHYRLEDMPLLPGGTTVVGIDDNSLPVLYYYDFLRNEIVERIDGGHEVRISLFAATGNDPMGYYPGGLD